MSAHQMPRKNSLSADLLEHCIYCISHYNRKSVKPSTLKINSINESQQSMEKEKTYYYKKAFKGEKSA